MTKIVNILTSFCVGFVLSCSSPLSDNTANSQSSAYVTEDPQGPCDQIKKSVEFQDVTFDFDPCTFGNIKAEEIPDHRLKRAEDKPDLVAPGHLRFEFEKGPEGWKPFVEIYPLQRFPEMYAVNKVSVSRAKKDIFDLKKVIENPAYRVEGEIPYIPFVDASQSFQAHVASSQFRGGKGIYFVTYFDTEITLINNDHLRYIFEGVTSDGKYYVLAEIPVSVPFLPDGLTQNADEHGIEGLTYDELIEMVGAEPKSRKSSRYLELKKKYDAYFGAITSRIERTRQEDFAPDLGKLEELITSLKINK